MEIGLCKNNPTHFHLVRHWLISQFTGIKSIVFFDPNKHIESISKRFNIPPIQLIHSNIFILPTEDPKSIKLVDGLIVEKFGVVLLWDGQNFVAENF